MTASDPRPLVAHIVYRFDVGGLENGLVNLLNRLPTEHLRHAVIALTDVTAFRTRVARGDVAFIALNKGPGHAVKLFPRIAELCRRLRPAIVHTRNLAALEANVPAWYCGVPIRLHGEHGRDIGDLDGSRLRYRVVRRAYRPFVTEYVALSRDLERYLIDAIGVPASRVTRIVNGVDTDAFRPSGERRAVPGSPFRDPRLRIVGAVGRLKPVKNQTALARAFVAALARAPRLRSRLRLVIVGDGPLREEIAVILARADATELAWLPGARDDVADILRGLDVLALPSLAEGISNTILEAMASGLPVIATRVGGNDELVEDGATGTLVPAGDDDALAAAMVRYADDAVLASRAGSAGRARAERLFSLDAMVAHYGALYERLLRERNMPIGNARAAVAAGPHLRT